MSWPSNRTLPEVAARSPVRQLKKVDLPAPLGPIKPRMSPCCRVTLALSTALKLPKALVTSCASRSMRCSRRGRPLRLARLRQQAVEQLQDSAGLETRDQHDDGAVEHESKSCALAAEPVVGNLLERHQD